MRAEYQELIDELQKAGVSIGAVERLSQTIAASDNWPAAFVEVTKTGRRIGVSLMREHQPTDERLDQILQGYPFGRTQRRLVIQNVISHV